MSKFTKTVELYEDTLKSIVQSGDNWKSFLNTAGFVNKYDFKDQVLIYAQRPEAVACAEFSLWNDNMHCWIKKGSKGIALIDNDSDYSKLRYVFDVSDVYKKDGIGLLPYLWNYRDEHKEFIIKNFSERVSKKFDENDFIQSILEVADFYVDDDFTDLYEDFVFEGSSLESREDKQKILRETLVSSIAFNILNRCRVDLSDYNVFNFENISLFDTFNSIGNLGSLVQEVSSDIFKEIATSIKKYNKDNNIEENLVENLENISYNDNIEQMFDNERSEENENRLHPERRLSDSGNSTNGDGQNTIDEVGQNEEEIHGGESQSNIDRMDNVRDSEGETLGSTGESREDVRSVSTSDGRERERNGGSKENRSDELGSQDEQYQEQSRGDSEDGSDIHEVLEEDNTEEFNQLSFFPSYEEQSGNIAIAVANDSNVDATAFNLSLDEPVAEKIIRFYPVFSGYEFANKKYDYYQLALMGFSAENIAERIKDDIKGFKLGFIEDDKKMSLAYDDLGLVIATGTSVYKTSDENVVSFTYKEIAEKIIDLCKKGEYLNSEDVALSVDKYRNNLAESISFNLRDLAEDFELPNFLKEKPYGYPDATNFFREIIDDSEKKAELISFMKRDDLDYGDWQKNINELPNFIEQLEKIDNLDNYLSFDEPLDTIDEIKDFYISEDAIDSYVIPYASYRKGEIYEAYKNNDKKEIESIVRNHFTNGGGTGDESHVRHGYTKKQGLLIQQGEIMNPFDEVFFSWAKVRERIINILDNNPNDFISPEELEEYFLDKKLRDFTNDNQEIINKIGELEDFLFINKDDRYTDNESFYYRATKNLINEVNNESLDTILEILQNQQNALETKENIWLSISYPFGSMRYANVFVRSDGDWELQVFNEKGEEEDGAICTNQDLRIDKAVETCFEMAGMGSYDFENAFKIEEPDFELLQDESSKKEEVEFDDKVQNTENNISDFRDKLADNNFGLLTSNKVYNKFIEFIEQLKIGSIDDCFYTKFKVFDSDSFMDLNLDISKTEDGYFVQMAHNYVQNGDLMDDPLISFDVISDEKLIIPREYQLSSMAIYEAYDRISTEPNIIRQQNDALDFLSTWFNNIKEQGYQLREEEIYYEVEGEEYTPRIYFDKDGFVSAIDTDNEFIQDNLPQEYPELFKNSEQNKVLSEEEIKDIDNISAANFVITDNDFAKGSSKEKCKANINAIRLLKILEKEDRNATPDEQEILGKYVGWGGLSDVFDSSKSLWQNEYLEVKNLLTEEEYNSARSSTLNAHYTDPSIIKGIYGALEKMGFSKGNILEPSMGVGNFFGCLPESMRESKLYGVELDDVSGRIAKKLYPNAKIKVGGFEDTTYSNDFFDVVIGNVPFGDYQVSDRDYKNNNFLIHDYFFAKALDKVRPGGIVAFITSKGTLDKKNNDVRKYISERADLIGAIRLPNNAFKNAGTEVTSDIIFLQKRETPLIEEPSWVNLTQKGGITINNYFEENPEMICGNMKMVSGRFGKESACVSDDNFDEEFNNALNNISKAASFEEVESFDNSVNNEFNEQIIEAIDGVHNYSYCIIDEQIYYRENANMTQVDLSDTQKERVKLMIKIRECAYDVLDYQLEERSSIEIEQKQLELNNLYDEFVDKYGYITTVGRSNTNERLFRNDYGYPLISSLEEFDEDGNYLGKAPIFTQRTVSNISVPDKVDTSYEALILSLNEKGQINLPFMADKIDKAPDKILNDLEGVIFMNPLTEEYETAEEYLSGNVREKLQIAEEYAKDNDKYIINVEHLRNVQPEKLEAQDIEIRLGSTWLEPEIINQFMMDVLKTPSRLISWGSVSVQYSKYTNQWNINGKSADYGNSVVDFTYGTSRANAYKILEETLNLRDIRIYDTIEDDNGKEKRILNQKETAIAQQKQEALKEAFAEWVFEDIDRRNKLVDKYNEIFNSIRPREYDGSFLSFPGMALDIELKDYQKNAVARMLYGGNTLLAHCVGAGKTYEMASAAMESKRLGLCSKSLFVVPNHLTEQWGAEFLRLYPTAKILVATKKDFKPANRKKFCSRIATGDYDAVIIGHSQFEKIPLSVEREIRIIERQIEDVMSAIDNAVNKNWESKSSYSVKQMERARKQLEAKLDKLYDSKKDDTVTFEQLGIDRLFVDESHFYKNLFLPTKMRNVSGVTSSESKKSSDMYSKCMYLDEITGGKGVTFATGTPISNTLSEMYTNMKYLQSGTLKKMGLDSFDSWAAAFAESKTEMELAPEGTGYRLKTRLARFFNLPELISIFKECADIKTADMLDLPVPKANFEDVVLNASDFQKEMVSSFAERAEKIRGGGVNPKEDNMLKITNDGRYLALDERMINPDAIDDGNNKATSCADKAFEIWQETKNEKSTQLIFSDISTPKGDGTFSIYEDIRDKLINKGVPLEEIAFIHDANTEKKKSDLFAKVRSGKVRFLFGSTQKLGAGTNVQDKLIALHHLDVPWRPADIEQQEGRIIRRGNENSEVNIFRYIKKGTFDSYSWQLIEKKQRFISQVMTSKVPVRTADDIDEATLSYAEVKALATDNPKIKEKMELDNSLQKLRLARSNYLNQKYRLQDEIATKFPMQLASVDELIQGLEKDNDRSKLYINTDDDKFFITINDKIYSDKKEGADALMNAIKEKGNSKDFVSIGFYKDFELFVCFDPWSKNKILNVKGDVSHKFNPSDSEFGTLTRIDNAIDKISDELEAARVRYSDLEEKLREAKKEVEKPFAQEQEYISKTKRLKQLELELDLDDSNEEKIEEHLTDEEKLETIKENVDTCKDIIKNNGKKASDELSNKWVIEVEKSNLDEFPYNAKQVRSDGVYSGQGLYLKTLEECNFYKNFFDNGYGFYVSSNSKLEHLYNLLNDDSKTFKIDSYMKDGFYVCDVLSSTNGVVFETEDVESMLFQNEEQVEKFGEFISNKDFKKELVSEIVKGEVIEEDVPENDERFSMYNEKDFINDKNKFAIYQLKDNVPNDLAFESLEKINNKGFDVDRANYDLVYIGDYNPDMTLEGLFEEFNINRPVDFKGHSLSVSDIIVINDGVNISSHYCDDIGFKNINDFIKKSKFNDSIIIDDNGEVTDLDEEKSVAQVSDTHISEEVRRERLRASHDASYQHQDLESQEVAEEQEEIDSSKKIS